MSDSAYCYDCRGVVKVVEGHCEHGHPRSSLRALPESVTVSAPAAAPAPVVSPEPAASPVAQAPAVYPAPPAPAQMSAPATAVPSPSAGTATLAGTIIKRVIWNLYAWPITLAVIAASLAAIRSQGVLGVADLVFSLPLYVALHLHIWDKKLFGPVVWRIGISAFVPWQLAYVFYLGPQFGGQPAGWAMMIPLLIQLPMFIAGFTYAFRGWPGQAAASAQAPLAPRARANRVALTVTVLIMAALVAFGYGRAFIVRHPEYTLRSMMPATGVYHPSIPAPPATKRAVATANVTAQECLHLRALFESGDYDALNERLGEIQAELEADGANDATSSVVYSMFNRPSDERLLDAWVEYSPEEYQPYVARAEYRLTRGWEARGYAYANKTSDAQFRRMKWWMEQASADVDTALALNPKVLACHLMRIQMSMLAGDDELEPGRVFEEARAILPDSFHLYNAMTSPLCPRWGGSYEELEAFAAEAIRSHPSDPRFYSLAGVVYVDQAELLQADKRYGAALDLFGRALAYAERASVLKERSVLYSVLNKNDEARRDMDRALALAQWDTDILVASARLNDWQEDPDGLARDMRAAAAINPEDPEVKDMLLYTFGNQRLPSDDSQE